MRGNARDVHECAQRNARASARVRARDMKSSRAQRLPERPCLVSVWASISSLCLVRSPPIYFWFARLLRMVGSGSSRRLFPEFRHVNQVPALKRVCFVLLFHGLFVRPGLNRPVWRFSSVVLASGSVCSSLVGSVWVWVWFCVYGYGASWRLVWSGSTGPGMSVHCPFELVPGSVSLLVRWHGWGPAVRGCLPGVCGLLPASGPSGASLPSFGLSGHPTPRVQAFGLPGVH